jgi:hypothetical protein
VCDIKMWLLFISTKFCVDVVIFRKLCSRKLSCENSRNVIRYIRKMSIINVIFSSELSFVRKVS